MYFVVMKTLKNQLKKDLTLWAGIISVFSSAFSLYAVEQQDNQNLCDNPPQSGTFYLLSAQTLGIPAPPYPCNPYPDEWQIPVYFQGDNTYLIADTPEDAAELISSVTPFAWRSGGMRSLSNGLPPLPGGSTNTNSTNTNSGSYQITFPELNTNGLWMEVFLNNMSNLVMVVHNMEIGGEYLIETNSVAEPSIWGFDYSFIATSNIMQLSENIGYYQSQSDSYFFRVVDISPVAEPDYFMVQQDIPNNWLDILDNDYVLGDDCLAVSYVAQPLHGTNEYEIGTFAYLQPFYLEYTPDPGYYGIDSFNYAITNSYGGSKMASATVFVNKTGNESPSANTNMVFVLQTNAYTASFNVLTNVIDNDNDTLSLFSVTSPKLGTVDFDAQGNIVYTRNTNSFGCDCFSYIVTDGKGGFLRDDIFVKQIENTNNPGIPIQWLLHHKMDINYTNTFCDPDNDGLSNLAEFLLGTDPLKPKNPLDLEYLEDGATIGGEIQIPLVGIPANFDEPEIGLLLNGELLDSYIIQNIDGVWILRWDPENIDNGTYTIQAALFYSHDYKNYMEVGIPKTITIFNFIKFNRIYDYYTDTLFLDYSLKIPSALCETRLYDNYNNLVDTDFTILEQNTTNRLHLSCSIPEEIDPIRVKRMRADIIVYPFEVSINGVTNYSGVYYGKSKTYLKENHIQNRNNFSVAWGWKDAIWPFTDSFINARNTLMHDAVIDILGELLGPYHLLPEGRNPTLGSISFRLDTKEDEKVLLDALSKSSHFFWFGHCGPEQLYGDSDKSKAHLEAGYVQEKLNNMGYPVKKGSKVKNNYPYKLVVLNGCNSYSQYWARAFGVDYISGTNKVSVEEYLDAHRDPRAFVGWKDQIDIPSHLIVPYYERHTEYTEALQTLWVNWKSEEPIETCLHAFAEKASENGFDGLDSYAISGCYDLKITDNYIFQ